MIPLAYLLTFRAYGTWLPGDDRGSTDPRHTGFGTPWRPPRPALEREALLAMRGARRSLDARSAAIVGCAIQSVATHRQWPLHAHYVGAEHVHVVLTAGDPPMKVVGLLKSYATRRLREAGVRGPQERIWSSGASTLHLFTLEGVARAVAYVEAHGREPRALDRAHGG